MTVIRITRTFYMMQPMPLEISDSKTSFQQQHNRQCPVLQNNLQLDDTLSRHLYKKPQIYISTL